MIAARLYGKEDLRVEEMPVPDIGAGEVLLRTGAASVCGTDVRMWRHGHPLATAAAPLVIGHELAGTIVRVGADVRGFHPGQRVCIAPNYNPVSTRLTVAGDGHLDTVVDAGGQLRRAFEEASRAIDAMLPIESHSGSDTMCTT